MMSPNTPEVTPRSPLPRPCEVCQALSFEVRFEKNGHQFSQCSRCDLVRIDPPPTDDTLARIYGEHYYDAWGLRTDSGEVERMKQVTFRMNLESLGPAPRGAKLLDCGAATGFLMGVADTLGYVPYAVELSDFGAKEIEKRFGEGRVFQGELEHAEFGLRFSVITMYDFLEHVRDPARTLRRAFELLEPGGRISITTPDTGSLSHLGMRQRWSHYKVEHLYYFNRKNLSRLLESAGFRSVTTQKAVKGMNLRYFSEQMRTYPVPVATPLTRVLLKVVPGPLAYKIVRVPMGEMLVNAVRP